MKISELSLKVWANEALQMRPYDNPLFPPSPYYRFFKVLSQYTKPKTSVVLGVCGGGCCLHLAMGNPDGNVIGIDSIWDHPEQINHIQSVCQNFKFWIGDSVNAAPTIFERYGEVDLVFIDTIHVFDRTVDEFNAWLPFLSDKGLVCFDDLFRKEMDGFWEWLPEPKLRIDSLHDGSESGGGFGVWWKSD